MGPSGVPTVPGHHARRHRHTNEAVVDPWPGELDLCAGTFPQRVHQHREPVRPTIDERKVMAAFWTTCSSRSPTGPGLPLIEGRGFASKESEADLVFQAAGLPHPPFRREQPAAAHHPAGRRGAGRICQRRSSRIRTRG